MAGSAAFAQDVKACALGQASAALLGRNVIGRTRAEVETARDQLKAMLAADGAAAIRALRRATKCWNPRAHTAIATRRSCSSLEATADAMAEAERAACA
jgi:NifU-like protein involved in Fe-S cluster formation